MHPIIKPQKNFVMHKEVISIDGVDKDISKWKNNNEFEISLPYPIQNVSYIKIKDLTLPNLLHNISSNKQNSKMSIQYANPVFGTALNKSQHEGDITKTITVSDGYYSPVNLATVLQNQLNRAVYNDLEVQPFKVKYNPVTNKMLVGVTEGEFKLLFTQEQSYQGKCSGKNKFNNYIDWGLGCIMGFDKQDYTSTSYDITSQDPYTQLKTGITLDTEDTAWLVPTMEQSGSNSKVAYVESINNVDTAKYDTLYIELDKHNYINEIQPYSDNTSGSFNNNLVFKNNSAFAKVSLIKNNIITASMVAGQFFNKLAYHSGEITSNSHNYNPPIKTLNKLKFKFRHHDGLMAEFNKSSPSLTLEIGSLLEEYPSHIKVRHPY